MEYFASMAVSRSPLIRSFNKTSPGFLRGPSEYRRNLASGLLAVSQDKQAAHHEEKAEGDGSRGFRHGGDGGVDGGRVVVELGAGSNAAGKLHGFTGIEVDGATEGGVRGDGQVVEIEEAVIGEHENIGAAGVARAE